MPQFRAIIVEPESAGNIGFIARLIENFAVDEFFIVNPQCDIDETAETRAVHAQETLSSARIVDDMEYAVSGLDYLVGTTGVDVSDENLVRSSVTPEQMTEQVPDDAVVGIMLGREGKGLNNEELDRCDFVVSIPASEDYPVMNLSHAAAVMFYECFTGTGSTNTLDGTSSSRDEREVLENLFKDATETVKWDHHRQDKAVRAFRNVLGRSYITGRECSLLLGLFRELTNKLQADVTVESHTDKV